MNRSLSFLKVAAVAFFSCASLAHANSVFVGSCGKPSYTTIQAAVSASASPGVVNICPGIYPEQVVVNKKNLVLAGVAVGNTNQVIIASPPGGVVVNTSDLYDPSSSPVAAQVLVQNGTVSISGVIVDGGNNGIAGCSPDIRSIYYQNASGAITNVVTRNQALPSAGLIGCQSGQGIFVQASYGASHNQLVTITNNSVHCFQKNGITVDGTVSALIADNQVVGQGPTSGAAENGVQVSDGAQANVLDNVFNDLIWAPDTASQPYNAASGILIYASQNVEVGGNNVGSTQFGIATTTDPVNGATPANPKGLADHTNIHNNEISGTQIFDAIDTCSDNNQITANQIFYATESAIHLDSTCSTGNSKTGSQNTVSGNQINESCAAVLNGGTSNSLGSNSYSNVTNLLLAGDVCPATPTAPSVANFAVINAAVSVAARPTPVL